MNSFWYFLQIKAVTYTINSDLDSCSSDADEISIDASEITKLDSDDCDSDVSYYEFEDNTDVDAMSRLLLEEDDRVKLF